MSQDALDSRELDQIAEALLEKSGCFGDVCPATAPLPNVEAVVGIMVDLRDLLFPGIHRVRRPQAGSLTAEARSSLTRIGVRLQREVALAIEHSRQVQWKVHPSGPETCEVAAGMTRRFLSSLPQLQKLLQSDVQAAFDGDPAARSCDEIILCYPGIEAITCYRIAHELLRLGVPYLPRIMTEWAHRQTGIDIHPGARIGGSFFIDHGTGVVIGETCEIGSGVTLYQGVTLGAWSFPRDEEGQLIRGTKRHPTLEDRVTVYSNATILGGTTVIGAGSLIGSSVSLNRSVPPNTIVTIERPLLKFRDAA